MTVRYYKSKSKAYCQYTVFGERHIERFESYKRDTQHLHNGTGRVFWQYRVKKNKQKKIISYYHHKQPLGKQWFYSYPRTIAKALKLPHPEKYSGHSICGTGATIKADSGATVVELQRYGNWKSPKVAMGYVRNSKKNQDQNAELFADTDGSAKNKNNKKRKSSDKEESDEVIDKPDVIEPPPKKPRSDKNLKDIFQNSTFNNCTFTFS